MKILSLFDGMSVAQQALKNANIPVEAYYASEIDEYAIAVTRSNFPDTIQLGDVENIFYNETFHELWVRKSDIRFMGSNIDLLIGGSPCQDLSIAKKDRKGLDGERSGLFWEYVRILKEVKPKYFILENVNSMPKEAKHIISETLGVEPIMINAALVSAQNRKRLFFCGQIRERLYFNDVLCYTCLQDENKGISRKTQNKGTEKILGETPERYCDMQNMPKGIQKDRQTRNNEDLLNSMSRSEQETERQEKGQNSEKKVSENIPEKESSEIIGVSKEVSSVGSGQRKDEGSRFQTTQEDCKSNEDSLSKRIDGNKKDNDERGSVGDSQYETDMFCVSCHQRLNNRPYRSFISGWNEQPRKSPSIMSEVQFNEARQNNGRIFDIYQLEITLPEDRGILLKDILEEGTLEIEKAHCIDANYFKGGKIGGTHQSSKRNYTIRIGQIGKGGQGDRIYSPEGKLVGLSALGGGRGAKTGLYAIVPEATKKGYAVATDGQSVDLSFPTSKTRRGRVGDKVKNLMTSQNIGVFTEGIIRKLTPTECLRLQSLPDNYFDGAEYKGKPISNSQRYKMCGNAFNCEVIKHILSFIK
jgi:DNA-cytosine methyltransferase